MVIQRDGDLMPSNKQIKRTVNLPRLFEALDPMLPDLRGALP